MTELSIPLQNVLDGPGRTDLIPKAQYGFDNDGRLTDLYYPGNMSESPSLTSGQRYQCSYDILGRATGLNVAGGATLVSGATYNAASQLTGWTEGSTPMSRSYDAQRGWVTDVTAGTSNSILEQESVSLIRPRPLSQVVL